jgi:hypothetical protein
VAGTFTGLFFDPNTNRIHLEDSGFVTLKLTKRGTFTGKLTMNTGKYPFGGQFDSFGRNNFSVIRRGRAPAVLALQLDLSGDTDQLHGAVTTAAGTNLLTSDLLADRNVFNPPAHPAPQAGRHFFLLQPPSDVQGQSIGMTSTRISPSGKTQIHGSFNDGQKFSLGTAISKDDNVPFYISLSRGTEAIIGWLQFGKTPEDPAPSQLWQLRSAASETPARVQISPLNE